MMSVTAEVLLAALSVIVTVACFLLGWAIRLLYGIHRDLVDLTRRTIVLEEHDAAKEARLSLVEERCWEAHGSGTAIHAGLPRR